MLLLLSKEAIKNENGNSIRKHINEIPPQCTGDAQKPVRKRPSGLQRFRLIVTDVK